MNISTIFKDEPQQWGLRGDPLLWRDMSKILVCEPMPASSAKLEILLIKTLEQLTGAKFETEDSIVVEKYKSHGMSSGGISFRFWREKGIPLLVSRYAKT